MGLHLVREIDIFPNGRLDITDDKGTRTYSWKIIKISGISEALKGKTRQDIIRELERAKARMEVAKSIDDQKWITKLEGYIEALKWILED